MSDQVFIVLSIFLIVEILSQLFKLEALGKIFVQFYVVLMHLFVVAVLVSYETRDMVYYFVSLVAVVNTLRYVLYKIPAFSESGTPRLFLDLVIILTLGSLLVTLSGFFPVDTPPTGLHADYMIYFVASLGLILLYEMWQKAAGVGLDIRNYLPDTFGSFFFVMGFIGLFIVSAVALFMVAETYYNMIINYTPLVIAFVAMVMIFITKYRPDVIERYSLLYILPTMFMFVQFVSVFVS